MRRSLALGAFAAALSVFTGCPPLPPPPAAALLSRSLDGSYLVVTDRRLRFKYEEKYIDGQLDYKVLDGTHTVVMDGTTNPVAKAYGVNWLEIDLPSQLPDGKHYILTVTDPKGRETFVRFKIKD